MSRRKTTGNLVKLNTELGLNVCDHPFPIIAEIALAEAWTRDPFDRTIVAHARANGARPLLTEDEVIRANYHNGQMVIGLHRPVHKVGRSGPTGTCRRRLTRPEDVIDCYSEILQGGRMSLRICAIGLLAGLSTFAQGYLSGVALNKKIVTDFYRIVFEPRNPDLVDQYVAPDFVEHNPRVEGGRDGLVKFIKTLPRPENEDVGTEMKNPPAHIVAEGDLVTFIFKQSTPDPKDKSKSYDHFTFDMFRIKNGKIVEHWDGATK